MMEIYLYGKRVRVQPGQSIGKGGEADIFNIGKGIALKVFKGPDHPDYAGQPAEQQAARERIEEHQQKLRAFPAGLPQRVIQPLTAAMDRNGQVIGYTMRLLKDAELLLRYGDRNYRALSGIDNSAVCRLFADLQTTVASVHANNVVIGDFNDLNVMIEQAAACVIDCDSFQYGPYLSRTYTRKYLDPLRCDPATNVLFPAVPAGIGSDWYAYATLLLQSLLYIDPYGGIYRPKNAGARLPEEQRPLRRITIFSPDVRYPRAAVHFSVLPDELLEEFHQVFEKDARRPFPAPLLAMPWSRCKTCGTEHARLQCPVCSPVTAAPTAVVVTVRGGVQCRPIFSTRGTILHAVFQDRELRWVYHDKGTFLREDGSPLYSGPLQPGLRFGICGKTTIAAKGDRMRVLRGSGTEEAAEPVDLFAGRPVFAVNGSGRYWIRDGKLQRDDRFGSALIGEVLPGQTQFWVGDRFGFGFYRAANLSVAFVFDARQPGIRDTVPIRLHGQLIDAACVFSEDRCWFIAATSMGGETFYDCWCIRQDGTVCAHERDREGSGSWLTAAAISSSCAAGPFLFVPGEDGLIRLETSGERIAKTREFPETSSFVDAGCRLVAGSQGLYVVTPREIRLLTLQQQQQQRS